MHYCSCSPLYFAAAQMVAVTYLLTFPLEASYSLFLPSMEFFNTQAAKRENITKGRPACRNSCPADGTSSTAEECLLVVFNLSVADDDDDNDAVADDADDNGTALC